MLKGTSFLTALFDVSSDVFIVGCQRASLPLTGNLLFISLNLCTSQRTPTVFVRCHDILPPHTDWEFSYCPKEKDKTKRTQARHTAETGQNKSSNTNNKNKLQIQSASKACSDRGYIFSLFSESQVCSMVQWLVVFVELCAHLQLFYGFWPCTQKHTYRNRSTNRDLQTVSEKIFDLYCETKCDIFAWSRLKACGMCTQCVSASDKRPTRQLLLKANSCNVHYTTHWGLEAGEKNGDNELISPLFEHITTLAQLHQFTRAERTEEMSHNPTGHGTQVPP